MPIQIPCDCGKTLRVKEDLAGKKVRCPGCQEILVVPHPVAPDDDDDSSPAAISAAPVKKGPPKPKFDDDEESTAVTAKPSVKGASRSAVDDDDEEDEDRPRSRKSRVQDDDDEGDDDRSYLKGRKRRSRADAPPINDGSGIPASVGVGVLMMVGAIVWFVGGLAVGVIFYYPPILFIVGIASVVKGALRK